MKVTLEGKEYEIDLEKAKELGVIKEDNSIKDFEVGDVFSSGFNPILIVQNGWPDASKEKRYNIAGLDGMHLYSDFGNKGASKQEMLNYLNYGRRGEDLQFIKNVNSEIDTLLRNTLKK
jgi:hypothetical protein